MQVPIFLFCLCIFKHLFHSEQFLISKSRYHTESKGGTKGMMRGERLRASGVAIAVPLLALAALAALAYSGHVRSQRDALGQIGEETFVDPLSTATPSDMAAKIQGILVSILSLLCSSSRMRCVMNACPRRPRRLPRTLCVRARSPAMLFSASRLPLACFPLSNLLLTRDFVRVLGQPEKGSSAPEEDRRACQAEATRAD